MSEKKEDKKEPRSLGTMNVRGHKFNIISQEDAEEVDCVVCLRISELPDGKPYFKDDVRVPCAGCGAPILHRPTAPRKPPKVCGQCALMLFPPDSDDKKKKTMH